MADEPSPVEITPSTATKEQHRMGVLGALAKRFIEQMYFRNILAVMMVSTMCYKELQGIDISENFYMLVGLVIGMYFKTIEKANS